MVIVPPKSHEKVEPREEGGIGRENFLHGRFEDELVLFFSLRVLDLILGLG